MLAGGFEFIPDQPQPKQPSAEGVFFVLRLGFDAGSAPLHKRLMGDGEAKLDIGFDLTGMKGGVEHTEFYRAFGEHTVQIQRMVAAIVVVNIPSASAVVPKLFHFLHRPGTLVVEFLQKSCVRFLAVMLPVYLYLQGFVQQILLGCHDIHNVAERLRGMGGGVHMDMDATGFIYPCTACAELPHKLLYGFDILISADGRDELHRIVPSGCSVVSAPAADGGIADHLPLPVLGIPHSVGVVPAAHMGCIGAEVSGDNSRCGAPC